MAKKRKRHSAGESHPVQRRSGQHASPATGGAPDDAIMAEMRIASRTHLGLIWRSVRLGLPLTGEDALTARIMRQHEEWYGVWDQLAEDPNRDVEVDGASPILHIMFHGTVENQLAANEPEDVGLVLQALQRQGLDRHDAIHRVAAVQSEEVYAVLNEQRPFDTAEYIRRLWELVDQDTAVH